MPARNTVRSYDIPAYYHVYNRGAGKQKIFYDDEDKERFISLLQRHLDPEDEHYRDDGVAYEKYPVELIAYCLMDNHFHLLLYQEQDVAAVSKLMKSIGVAYTMYFNHRYGTSGHLFQGIFKASRITGDAYLEHITRYIHLNPSDYKKYKWSSLAKYLGKDDTSWIHPERVLTKTPSQYLKFVDEYSKYRDDMSDEISDLLAD